MAAKLITTIKRFFGTPSDTKPGVGDDLPVGSRFEYADGSYDTWDGYSWQPSGVDVTPDSPSATGSSPSDGLAELLGDVVDEPASNTLLGRLASIWLAVQEVAQSIAGLGTPANPLVSAGTLFEATAEFQRPNNTTAYTAADVVGDGTLLRFQGVGRVPSGRGYIVAVTIMTDDAAISALPRMRLHVFSREVPAIADNGPFTTLIAQKHIRRGHIDFDALKLEGSGSDAVHAAATPNTASNLPLPFLADGNGDLYAMLISQDAFTPAALKNWIVRMTVERY